MIGWKEAAFCDSLVVIDPTSTPSTHSLFNSSELCCVSSSLASDNQLITTAFTTGNVLGFNADFEQKFMFNVGNRAIERVYHLPSNLVLVVTSKVGTPIELVVYKLSGELHARLQVPNQTNTYPLTAFDMLPDMSVICLAFGDGSVVVVRGDLLHDRGAKHRQVFMASTSITNLCLVDSGNELFVSSVDQLVVLSTTQSHQPTYLEKLRGCDVNCMAKIGNKSEILVASDSGLVVYNLQHKISGLELTAKKRELRLSSDGRYAVLLIAQSTQPSSLLAKEELRTVIIDLELKLVCFNGGSTNAVRGVLSVWDKFLVLNSEYQFLMISLKPLNVRINTLSAQHSYQLAIRLAELENAGNDEVCDLHCKFGDFLFAKNDVESSLQEYISGIREGHTSNAIQRFKNSHHADLLSRYLTQLFMKNAASPQHLTLQTICLCKLGKYEDLKLFLESACELEGFEFQECIDVLMDANTPECAELAAQLARKWPDSDLAVQIMLRTLCNAEQVLKYVQTLTANEALRILVTNAKALLQIMPEQTTEVLVKLFTGTHGLATSTYEELAYLPPKPRLIFPAFINHNSQFIHFLRAVLSFPHFRDSKPDLCDLGTSLFGALVRDHQFVEATEFITTNLSSLRPVETLLMAKTHGYTFPPAAYAQLTDDCNSALQSALATQNYEEATKFILDLELYQLGIDALTTDPNFATHLRSTDNLTKLLKLAFENSPPAHLTRILGNSPHLTVKDLKPALLAQFSKLNESRVRSQQLSTTYASEISQKQTQISLQNQEFLKFSSKCQVCELDLEVPSVQFACTHAYHRQCLSSNISNCPKCHPQHESLQQYREQTIRAEAQEEFANEQLAAKPQMSTIGDLIAQNMLN